MMQKINNLTILITVHERKKYLKRLLTYYRNFDYPIIVVDSSKIPVNLKKDFPQVKFNHYPGVDYFENLYRGICQVNTEYVLQLPDDDFAIKKGLISCLQFLDKHKNYVGATGQGIVFYESKGQYKPQYNQKKYFELLKLDYKNSNPFNRLQFFFKHGVTQVHCILKKKVWLEYLTMIRENTHFYSSQYFEMMFSYLIYLTGNFKFLPEVSILRSDGLSVYHGKNFSDKRIHKNYNYKNLIFKLWLYGDPLSNLLAKKTRKNILYCRLFTTYIIIFKFIGIKSFIKHLYLQVAMSVARISPLQLKLIHRKILKLIGLLYSFSNDLLKKQKGQTTLIVSADIKDNSSLRASPFYKKKYQQDLIYISKLIRINK